MKKIILPNITVASIKEPESKDPDLLWMEFWLCHEGANANGDYFTKERLEEAHQTPVKKYINWNHKPPHIGFIEQAELLNDEDCNKLGIFCGAYVWKYAYPNLAYQIRMGFKSGDLKMSMECYFQEAEYWVGDDEDKKVYNQGEAEQLGITRLVGRTYEGKPVYRVFLSPLIFGGAGVVTNPADEDAWIKNVAEQEKQRMVKNFHDSLHYFYEVANPLELPERMLAELNRIVHKKGGEFIGS